MIDLRPIETQRNGQGYVLRCPKCGDWSRVLLIRDTGELVCRSCWQLLGAEEVGQGESVAHGAREQG